MSSNTCSVIKIFTVVICSAGIIAGLNYFTLASPDPKIRFAEDVKMDISGSSADIFALGNAQCDDINFFGSYLTADINTGSDFRIGNSPSNYLSVNPTDGLARLILAGTDMDSAGHISSWQIAGVSTASTHIEIKTARTSTYYDIKANNSVYVSADSGTSGQIAFDYNDLTATTTFELVEAARTVSDAGIPLWFIQLLSEQSRKSTPSSTPENISTSTMPGNNENELIIDSQDQKKMENLFSQEAFNFIESSGAAETPAKINLRSILNALMAKVKKIFGPDKTIERFIRVGTPTSLRLGEGERAGLVTSYKESFEHTPRSRADWEDVIRLANGLPPIKRNLKVENKANRLFAQIFKRSRLLNNEIDTRSFNILAYGMRPFVRNLSKEKNAISVFINEYHKRPTTNQDWNIVRAIAYR
jgi:hypothetical protein